MRRRAGNLLPFFQGKGENVNTVVKCFTICGTTSVPRWHLTIPSIPALRSRGPVA